MLTLLGIVLPLGLAGAVSPVMLSEQLLLLARPDGRRLARAYAAGTLTILVAWVGAIWLFRRAIPVPRLPSLDAALDLAFGVVLVGLGAWLALSAQHPGTRHADRRERAGAPLPAYGFGLFSMATDFTTLPLVAVAAKDVATSGEPEWQQVVALVVLIALADLPAWGPLAALAMPGQGTERTLAHVSEFTSAQGRRLAAALLLLVGLLLVGRGLMRFVGA